MLPPFFLARPDRLDDALGLLDDAHVPYCGGTELLMAMKLGLVRPAGLVDLKHLRDLRGVRWQDGDLVVGAAVSHAELASDTALAERFPLLASVERRVGNARVRSQGSIGGNLCFAEPRSDVTTLLSALGTSVVLASRTGRREIAMSDFLIGAYETTRRSDELLVEVVVPGAAHQRGVYLKYQYAERPVVGAGLVLDDLEGRWRLAVGAVGEKPFVTEYSALGEIDPDAVASQVDPVEDIGGSIPYKRNLTAVILRRVLRVVSESEVA